MSTQITEATTNLDNQIAKSSASQSVMPPKCYFSGNVDENPNLFIKSMSQYFLCAEIEDNREKIVGFRRRLDDKARDWYNRTQTNCERTYENLVNEFAKYFNAHIYEKGQKSGESVVVFTTRMERLFKRQNTAMSPERAIRIIISLMRPELKKRLKRNNSSEKFLDVATNIEDNIKAANINSKSLCGI